MSKIQWQVTRPKRLNYSARITKANISQMAKILGGVVLDESRGRGILCVVSPTEALSVDATIMARPGDWVMIDAVDLGATVIKDSEFRKNYRVS